MMISTSNYMLFGFTECVKALQHVYAYMDVGGRATHDSKDGGGRNASGTAFEEQLPSSPVCLDAGGRTNQETESRTTLHAVITMDGVYAGFAWSKKPAQLRILGS